MHLNPSSAPPALVPGTTQSKPERRWYHIRHSVAWMVLVGFLARLLYILIARSYHFRSNDDNFSFGWEIGRVAYSLATGHGFSSPFGGNTGPSAWNAPVYPWIVSIAFRLFGVYSHAAAFALLVFNSIFPA